MRYNLGAPTEQFREKKNGVQNEINVVGSLHDHYARIRSRYDDIFEFFFVCVWFIFMKVFSKNDHLSSIVIS